jgi:hypothetical protein
VDIEQIKRVGFSICKSCGGLFRVNIDDSTGKWSYERLQGDLKVTLHSPLLNADLNYVEPVMPDNVLDGLVKVMDMLKRASKLSKPSTFSVIHNVLDSGGAFSRDYSDKHLSQWILNDELPRLEALYNTYPVQVSGIMMSRELAQSFLAQFTVICMRCGLGVPRARAGTDGCLFCKDTAVQSKTSEDPVALLKLRLAKGEISKEQYEDLKRMVEN